MTKAITSEPAAPQAKTLVVKVSEELRSQIAKGRYKTGERLPSEAQMTQEFGVSRTVVREAIASLRSDGLVEPRQGAGVFVLEPPPVERRPFHNVDLARVSSLIEMLELRTAVEGDAAGLAAVRRSPAQEEKIIEAFDAFRASAAKGIPTAEADFAFHGCCRRNQQSALQRVLQVLGPTLIPRSRRCRKRQGNRAFTR